MRDETTVRRRGRPPTPDAADNIVEAATALFLEAGYTATTMQHVARRFGGSKQTIYARFPDKAALFRAVVQSFTERKLRAPRASAGLDGTAEEILRSVATSLLRVTLERDTILMNRLMIAEAVREPVLTTALHIESTTLALDFLRGIMARLVDTGGLAGDPARLAAWFSDLVVGTPLRNALFAPTMNDDVPAMFARQEEAIAFFLKAARR